MSSSMIDGSVHIRGAEAQDAQAIATMAQGLAAHEGIKSAFTVEAFLRDGVGEGTKAQFYVAELTDVSTDVSQVEGKTIIGFCMVYAGYDLTSATNGLHLGDIYMHSDWRAKGIGRALLAHACSIEKGAEWMSFTVMRGNKIAQKFYHKIGAQQVNVDFMAMGRSVLKAL